jgi:predicted dehydrogenase
MGILKIGIIGAGGIVKTRHLPGLTRLPDVRIVAVCNRTQASGEAVAREWNIPVVLTDWRALIARDDLDAVLIGTWPYMHAEMSIAALQAGKHVFCQARMARTAAEARAMLAAAQAAPDKVAMLCPPPMGMKGDRLMRKLIAEGYLGEPRQVYATGLSDVNIDPTAPLHWRQDFDLQGYNTLTLGMWIEVIHRWMGPHSKVAALWKTFTPARRDPNTGEMKAVKIAESVSIAAELVNGAMASYSFSGVTRFAPENTIQLYGTQGTLIYNLDTDEIRGARAGEAHLKPIPIPPNLVREWTVEADFVRAIREGTLVEPSFADGLLYMEFTEAVYRSHAQGRVIPLPLEERETPPPPE